MFTPKGSSVRSFTSTIAARSSPNVMVPAARMPSPPALLVAATSRGPATQPMPVCTIGYSTPSSSHSRVCNDGFTGSPPSPHLGPAQVARIEHLADQPELLVRGRARLLHIGVHDQREAGRLRDLVDRHAGMERAQPHGAVGR